MKPIYIILLVVLLLGGAGLTAFFVSRKNKSNKKSSPTPKVPNFERKENSSIVKKNNKQTSTTIGNKAPVKKAIESEIKVPHVDVGNRRFDYLMHYKGIPYKGVFEDGITNTVQVKKAFGSFVIKQRMNQTLGSVDDPIAAKAKAQKMRGGATIKIGTAIEGVKSLKSDWVDLFILDNKEKILEQLSVNLTTGETTKTAKIPKH